MTINMDITFWEATEMEGTVKVQSNIIIWLRKWYNMLTEIMQYSA